MTSGLIQHSLGGVNQNYCKIGKGCTNRHVSGIFLMTGGVGNNKTAVVCGEIAVGNIDGDTLFTFCKQTV